MHLEVQKPAFIISLAPIHLHDTTIPAALAVWEDPFYCPIPWTTQTATKETAPDSIVPTTVVIAPCGIRPRVTGMSGEGIGRGRQKTKCDVPSRTVLSSLT